jgi:hypothetical protein
MRGRPDGRGGGNTFEESPDSTKQWCRVTPGGGNPRESATENRPPVCGSGNRYHMQVRVKRWGKSPPQDGQPDWHGKPHQEQCQIGIACDASRGAAFAPAGPGWQLEARRQLRAKMNDHLGCGNAPRQNPAYRPSAHIDFLVSGPLI